MLQNNIALITENDFIRGSELPASLYLVLSVPAPSVVVPASVLFLLQNIT